MYRVIQVPLDGSSFAEQALPLAVSVARRDKALLELIRVYEPIPGLDQPPTFESRLDRELMNDAQSYLDAVVKRLTEATPICVSAMLVKGPIAETIVRQALDRESDLLVMTTRAQGALTRLWFGSTADALVRQSPIPVLLVPPKATAADISQPPESRHLLVPLDGSQLSEQAIEPMLALGGKQAEYTLLRVATPVVAAPTAHRSAGASGLTTSLLEQLDELNQRKQDEAAKYLERLAQGLRSRSLTVHTKAVLDAAPAGAVLDTASAIGAHIIAMATRGHGGLKRLFLGSVADKLVRGATMPVLICPPVEQPTAGLR